MWLGEGWWGWGWWWWSSPVSLVLSTTAFTSFAKVAADSPPSTAERFLGVHGCGHVDLYQRCHVAI